ncbi:hypothetical protein ABW21_db0205774 [Orbilia brochopaga]|nr:hypothetical protein ABW21_db0205774 [Drechslerella brochopaga]
MAETAVLLAAPVSKQLEEAHRPESSPSGGEYEVQKIVGEKTDKKTGRILYLVRWKNFSKDFDTWEPVSNLDGCEMVLDKWEERQKAKLIRKNNKVDPSKVVNKMSTAK